MSVFDRFINIVKLNDDEFDEDDFLDEEDDEVDEPRPDRRRITKFRDDDDGFDDLKENEPPSKPLLSESKPSPLIRTKSKNSSDTQLRQNSGKISPLRSRRSDASGPQLIIIKPKNVDDWREITEGLLANGIVILNTEGIEMDMAQRIIDFAAGTCYALDGNFQRISSYIFAITPSTVEISGDFPNIVAGAFDIPPTDRRY